MPDPLHAALVEHQLARRALLARYPDLAEDDPALLDTLDGMTNLREAILAVMASADEDDILVSGIRERIDSLESRMMRLESRIERKHEIVRNAMELGSYRKIEAPEMTLSLAKSQAALRIIDDKQLPPEYLTEKTVRRPDLMRIKEALIDGKLVPGAVLNNPADHLVIRRA